MGWIWIDFGFGVIEDENVDEDGVGDVKKDLVLEFGLFFGW